MKRISVLLAALFAVVLMFSATTVPVFAAAKPVELKLATVAPPVGSTGE